MCYDKMEGLQKEIKFFKNSEYYFKAHHHVASPRAFKKKKPKFIFSQSDFEINEI